MYRFGHKIIANGPTKCLPPLRRPGYRMFIHAFVLRRMRAKAGRIRDSVL